MDLSILADSRTAAQNLLGWDIYYAGPEGRVGGRIVETEAYHELDEASHSFGGQRARNAALFGPAGTVYIYFTYGMHYCLNIVTGNAGSGQGVLLRAIEPRDGLEIMFINRGGRGGVELTNGPAKLVQALGIQPDLNGLDFKSAGISFSRGEAPKHIVSASRVGISKAINKPWRFYDADSPYVSKPLARKKLLS